MILNFISNILSFGLFEVTMLKTMCIFLDGIIYKFADWALRGFFEIAKLSGNMSFLNIDVQSIVYRVMALAGVYALFRLAFMLINYIMNPDKTNEVSKNGGSYVKNIIIAVVLLISSSFIFEQMGRLQNLIIDGHVIENIIYGANADTDAVSLSNEKNSKKFVNNVFLLFFEDENNMCTDPNVSNKSTAYSIITTGGDVCNNLSLVQSGDNGIDSLIPVQNNFNYTPVISGIAGIVMIYYFVVYTIGLARRMIKLIVLQIISPIPIVTSIDPSQKGKLSKFARTYFDVWLQLFIRILTVYLAFVVCSIISNSGGVSSITNAASSGMLLEIGPILTLFVYIGIFQATKELPKLLEDALGTKIAPDTHGQGLGSLLKTIVGAGVGTTVGAVAGGVGGGVQGALTGALSGGLSGAANMANAKNVGAGVAAAVGAVRKGYGTGLATVAAGGVAGLAQAKFDNFTGRNARIDREVASAEKNFNAHENFEKAVMSDYAKSKDNNGNIIGTMDYTSDAAWMSANQDLNDYLKTHTETFRDQNEVDRLQDNVDSALFEFNNSERGAELKANMERAEQEFLAATPSYDNLEGLDMNSQEYATLQANFENAKSAYNNELNSYEGYKSALDAKNSYINSTTTDESIGRDLSKVKQLTDARSAARKSYEDDYKAKAFESFEKRLKDDFGTENTDGSVTLRQNELAFKYNSPAERVNLTESQKRYYELTREEGVLLPNDNSHTLEGNFTESKKASKKRLEESQGKQQTDQYRHADTAKNHKFGGK